MEEKSPRAMALRKKIQKTMTKYREKVSQSEFKAQDFELIPIDVKIPGLNPVFHNYKIINLSDIHLGQWITPNHLEGIVDLVNLQKPDMITITGDFVSYLIDEVEKPLERSLKRLKPVDASVAVLGNHDHWLGAEKIKSILKKCGIKDVSNDIFTLKKRITGNLVFYMWQE